MDKMIELHTSNYCLRINTTDKDWYRCSLLKEDEEILHGAGLSKYIVGRLWHVLDSEQPESDGYHHGRMWDWVLTLSEPHSMLYISTEGTDKILLWLDAKAEVIDTMRLTKEQGSQWVAQLASLGFDSDVKNYLVYSL
jgi:hypothetical protein